MAKISKWKDINKKLNQAFAGDFQFIENKE
nr:MAG TPA: hypothetical protein [Inoviridae sp.]